MEPLFKILDIVRIGDHPTLAAAGRVDELGESVIVQPLHLTPTGERLPRSGGSRAGSSTHVAVDGRVTGHSEYIIVDDIDSYL
jgi:hypothetical protein